MTFSEHRKGELLWETADVLPAVHAFTTRSGGVSEGIWSSLNLGFTRGDDPQRVAENYDILCESHLRPIINVEPTFESVCHELEQIALHPERIPPLKQQSIEYIERHHHYLKVAKAYERIYQQPW